MSEPVETRLADRYGRASAPAARRGRPVRRGVVLGILGVTAAVAAVAALTFGTSIGSDLTEQTSGYSIDSARLVSVTWQISGSPGEALVCTIAAQSLDSSVVGIRSLSVPASPSGGDRTGTTTVRTVREAASGLISSCRRA